VIAGAGGSIAGAVAGRLMAEGASVVGIDRQAIEASFPVIQADLAIEPEVRAAFERIGGERGPIHALYVNAGSVEREDTSLLSAPAEVWPRSFANIVLPTVFACRCAVPYMTGSRAARSS
jgi:NAD(P)-dependent dehydrogenase (short-subunit alcohol dehydrogenase family)